MEWRDHRGKLASPQNIGRRLRELVNEGKIAVEYRRNHAYYEGKGTDEIPLRAIVEWQRA
jgi:hypothetical protein